MPATTAYHRQINYAEMSGYYQTRAFTRVDLINRVKEVLATPGMVIDAMIINGTLGGTQWFYELRYHEMIDLDGSTL